MKTVCRICESACGLVATVDDAVVTGLRPDEDHPVSRGYACQKGLQFHERVQHHADRLERPLLFGKPVGWDEALKAIGDRLATLHRTYGPEAIGVYSGNAMGHSLGGVLGVTALQRAFGTTKHYSCLTLDNSEMFVVTEACLGNPLLTFVADYDSSDCVVLIGTDPLSSQPSQAQSHPDGTRQLLEVARHGRLVVVDPRRSLTASKASLHLAPRPGTDVLLLAHLLGAALEAGRTDDLAEAGQWAALREVLRERPSAEQVAARLDVPLADLSEVTTRVLEAKHPLVWSGLGVLLGPDGTLGYWLTLALQTALGGLDALGGWILQPGRFDLPSVVDRAGIRGRDPTIRSRVGGYPAVMGTVAAATLAEDVLTAGEGQLRALVVLGGNPLVALPNTARAEAALRALDLLVCVDLFVNDTGLLADAVLPATTWLERSAVPLHTSNQRRRPHIDDVHPVVPARGEARDDFEICCDLVRAAGKRPFGSRVVEWALWAGFTPTGLARRGLTLPPRQKAVGLRSRGTDRADGKVHLAVPEFLDALKVRLVQPEAQGFLLVTSVRPVETMNSWLHDGKAQKRRPVARMHPADLGALGDPERVTLQSRLTVPVLADEGVRRGVVVVPFGWGDVNPNVVVGTDVLEPFTGQPISNGQVVEVQGESA